MRKKLVLLAGGFFSSASFLYAQPGELDPVTVSASLNPVRASQTGRNLFVIKGEKLTALPVHSIDELLRYLPGLEVQARGPFGSQSDLTLRGGTFQQVLVIVDGMRVNDPNTGHFSTYIPIAPGEIDRIEILKGAGSALYGSDAVGGVVNIVTKSFAAKGAQKLQAAAQLTGGEYDFRGAQAGAFYSTGKTSIGGGLLANKTDGQRHRGLRGFVDATTVSASVGHRFSDKWSAALRTAYDTRTFAAQNFYTSALSDSAQETVKTFWNQMQLVRTAENNTLRLQVGYKNLKDSFAFNRLTPSNQNRTELWQALVTNERRLAANTTLTPGVQFVNKKIRSNDRGNHQVQQAAAFAVLNHQIGSSLFVAPALRLEWNSRTGYEVIPQAALSYRAGNLTLRGSAGKTIRDADFTERFNNYNKTFVPSGQSLGNPDLTEERSISYEAGADYFVGAALKLSGTFFQRRHQDLIDYVRTPYAAIPRKVNLSPAGTYPLAKNIADVTTTGWETDVQYNKTLPNKATLLATLGLVWLKSRSSDTVPSFYLSSHARFLTNFNVQYSSGRLLLSVNGLYKSRQPRAVASPDITKVSADYWVINTRAEGALVKNKLYLFAQVDNILDRSYTDLIGSRMPGRWAFGGVRISFDGKGSNE